MADKDVEFEKYPEDIKRLANFLAELEREGVTYVVSSGDRCYYVTLTGGY